MDKTLENLEEFKEYVSETSNRIVSCNGCVECCKTGGIVYVLPEEVQKLKEIGTNIIEIDGLNLIKRTHKGYCSMLDIQHNRCTIYEDRPLACRLFPLDVFYRNGVLEWGVYDYCPEDNIKPIITDGSNPRLDLFCLELIVSQIEKRIPLNVLNLLKNSDRTIARIELLDHHKDDFVIIDKILKT